jgi:hypothetical protein
VLSTTFEPSELDGLRRGLRALGALGTPDPVPDLLSA